MFGEPFQFVKKRIEIAFLDVSFVKREVKNGCYFHERTVGLFEEMGKILV